MKAEVALDAQLMASCKDILVLRRHNVLCCWHVQVEYEILLK